MKLYVNGDLIGSTTTAGSPTLNSSITHNIGKAGSNYFSGQMANIHFIDGQALDQNSFGETVNDIWIPKQYEGEYGTNGFHLDFAPENMEYSGDTITRVLDESPNSNHWYAH